MAHVDERTWPIQKGIFLDVGESISKKYGLDIPMMTC